MDIRITTKQVLKVLEVLSWIIFIGLCIDAGGLLVSFFELTLIPGGTLVLLPDFDADECLHVIERERVHHLNVASPIVEMFAASTSFDSTDLSSLRSVCIGTCSPMPCTSTTIAFGSTSGIHNSV